MAEQPIPISDISDPSQIRVKLLASTKDVHAPMSAFAAASVHGAPTKAVPVDADEIGYWDSVGLRAVKMTWANLKEGIRAFFYGANKVTPVDGDAVGLLDSATSYSPKYSTWAQIKATLKTYFDTLYQPLADSGAFTPAFSASGATFSYALQAGQYTKIGNAVHFFIALTLNTSGNTLTANALTITGLPFAANAVTGGDFPIRWANSTTSYVDIAARTSASSTNLILEGNTAAATSNTAALLANGALHATNGSTMRIFGFYFV